MPVLKKLNEARSLFHESKLEKTGHNKFAGYKYFELGDFLIPALRIFKSLDLCAVVSFGKEEAQMSITDLEDGSVLVITSPMSTAALKGCHEVQNLGAVQTYLRRYLWVAALEIVEHDAIDSSEPKRDSKLKSNPSEDKRKNELTEFALDLLDMHNSGKQMDAAKAWYDNGAWASDAATKAEEQKFVWECLKSASALRSFIKANKPEPATV